MLLKILRNWLQKKDCPHLLFYGPSGSGKKTLIMALIRQIFGATADKVKAENKVWKIDAGTRTIDVELTTLSSTHHVELSPGDAGFQDRYVVQEVIKEMAKNRSIDTKGKKSFKGIPSQTTKQYLQWTGRNMLQSLHQT
ncbi:PREDICTED: replication factor C subunit 3-like [Ipomoea nil]|uniref:replication factor C subunit 3-like n=1 Tax=Ipomoea nil TaxID=35883 RepID=UPI000901C081|nr:PREDICTED: replication factor C subunit 3-like [Ipomoea nil]